MRILVVFHIFYRELVQYYLDKLSNIRFCQWDLIVTSSSFTDELKDAVRAVNPGAAFLETENAGYDIWPFIRAIKSVNLSDYEFVIKLHTKNEDDYHILLNGKDFDGRAWKEALVEPLLGTRRNFIRVQSIFAARPGVGILFNSRLCFRSKGANPEDCEKLDAELARLGIERKGNFFCAGTMFAVRASALEFLQDGRISADIFETSGPSHAGGTMAHVYERLIPIAVQSQGYAYFPLNDGSADAARFFVKKWVTPALEWIFYVNYNGTEHRKQVRVFGLTVKK